MKFDHTFIAIRERTTLEIYDLSLHVLRDYFVPLIILLCVGVAPWMLLDWWLLGWMMNEGQNGGFGRAMTILVCCQAHVGTAMMTHYLGQSMFIGKPDVWASIKAIWQVPFTYYWLHYGLRMLLPAMFFAVAYRLNRFDEELSILCYATLTICVCIGLLVRGLRPYVTKIVILERAPWKAKPGSPIEFAKRSASLHGAGSSNIFSRFILSVIVGLPLAIALHALLTTVYSWIGFSWGIGFIEIGICWPIALWLVAGFFAIVRFLTYIDLRIRQEGWEVELAIRAEALRLEQ